PEGVAIDERGRPTTDAGAARRGALLPFGGHKGYALALAMHALGVSAEYLFLAVKPDLFVPLEDYRRSLAAEIAAIKATPRQGRAARRCSLVWARKSSRSSAWVARKPDITGRGSANRARTGSSTTAARRA